jgi:hypothetical protein
MATGPCIDRLAIICHSDYYTYNEVFLINLRLYHPENTSHDHNIAVYTKIHSDSTFFCSTVIANLLAFSCRFIAAIYQLSKCVYISMPCHLIQCFYFISTVQSSPKWSVITNERHLSYQICYFHDDLRPLGSLFFKNPKSDPIYPIVG